MCQKLLIIISNIQFWVWDTNFSHFSPKKAKKNAFLDPNFCPADNKNAIETHFQAILSLQKSIGGFVIDILEKSYFFGSIGSQKDAKNAIFFQGGQNECKCFKESFVAFNKLQPLLSLLSMGNNDNMLISWLIDIQFRR